jgi:hypothetical protein
VIRKIKDEIKKKNAEIKKKNAPHLNETFSVDGLASKRPPTLGPSLRPHSLLFDLFNSGLDVSHIHIAARVPQTGMCYNGFYDLFLTFH